MRDDFELTSYEYSVCRGLADYTSRIRDPEYALRIRCFLRRYAALRDFPAPDMVEGLRAEVENEEPEELRAADLARRRSIVDKAMRRAGYEPTQAEHDALRAKQEAEINELHAPRGESGRAGNAVDAPEPEIYSERRHANT